MGDRKEGRKCDSPPPRGGPIYFLPRPPFQRAVRTWGVVTHLIISGIVSDKLTIEEGTHTMAGTPPAWLQKTQLKGQQ